MTILKMLKFLFLVTFLSWSPLAAEEGKKGAKISIGDKISKVLSVLSSSGSKDISGQVGIITMQKSLWFELEDNTCVLLLFDDERGEETLIAIRIGEKGRGYGGKLEWTKQNVKSLKYLSMESYKRKAVKGK